MVNSPTHVLIAIKTIEVGVETFSLTLTMDKVILFQHFYEFLPPEQQRKHGERADVNAAPSDSAEDPAKEADGKENNRLPHSEVWNLVEGFPLVFP